MNVLIFTGQFGMGHIAAAQALKQEILHQEPTAAVTVVDLMDTCFPQLRRLVYGCFDFLVNDCSGVYNTLNRLAGRYHCAPLKGSAMQKLNALLAATRAELILSTLPLSSQYVAAYKRTTGSSIPLYTYVTDLEAHREWVAPGTDCYFVADETTRRQLVRQGVPANRIVVSGIPVRRDFRPRRRPDTTRRELLVMGGGLGLIPNAAALLDALHPMPELHVTVITGKNESLGRELARNYPAFTVLGYTHQVAERMARADLLLTKAGGSTVFEAIHTGTPLCLLRPFLMQEAANAVYVERQGLGQVLWDQGTEGQQLLSLLRDREALADIRQRMAVTLRSLDPETALDRYGEEARKVC